MSNENVGNCPANEADDNQPLTIAKIDFDEPGSGGVESVLKDMTMPSTGKLCLCKGSVTGSAGQFLHSVFIKNVPGKDVAITEAETLQSSYSYYASLAPLSSPVQWNYYAQVPAKPGIPAAQGPAGSELDNTIRIVSLIYQPGGPMGTMMQVLPNQTKKIGYKGKGVTTCPASIAAATSCSSTVATAGSAPFLRSPTDRDPIDRDGDWLLYRSLSVSEFGAGSRLMQHGLPLRGNTVAFAAANVNWRRGQRRITYINRASGESTVAIGAMVWAPGAPLSCVMIGQPTLSGQPSVIDSECRNKPVVLNLEGGDDIFAQVNFDFNDFTSRAGGFDLWVKVID